ncbi:MAG TPA: MarR family winged helix-turn-helix transcriptional regulator [Bryobacteraceae bacterium]|nr:MarR family winged helix-turn-helix transcriptional regulator [Bryobacteraceae bacterium]
MDTLILMSRAQSAISDLESHTGFWLRFVSNHVSQAFAAKVRATGVTVAEWVMLRELYGVESSTPGVLAERTGLTRGAVSKLVERLVEKRLVSRRGREEDRRYQDLALTAAGRRITPRLAAMADANDAEFFAALTAEESAGLLAVLKKLVRVNGMHQIPVE